MKTLANTQNTRTPDPKATLSFACFYVNTYGAKGKKTSTKFFDGRKTTPDDVKAYALTLAAEQKSGHTVETVWLRKYLNPDGTYVPVRVVETFNAPSPTEKPAAKKVTATKKADNDEVAELKAQVAQLSDAVGKLVALFGTLSK